VLDTDTRELRRGRESIAVEPQVLDLLVYLVENRDRVVSKDDLIKAVWDGRIVSDAALTTRMNFARSAIGDSGEAQHLIKTLPRKGFRFVGIVREDTTGQADSPPQRPLTLPDKPSIAVLPFSNLSSDPEQDYFADGVVDDIITALSRFKSLFVIARNSSFTFKGKAVDLKQVGRELGVRYVLEGSVRKAGGRVRITCQLIDAATAAHIWAERYDGDLSNIFALQDEIAVNVISAIQPKLLQAEIDLAAARRPNDLSAYDLYLRATPRYYTITPEGIADALQLLSRALEIDPRYSRAASLAIFCHTLNLLAGWSADREFEAREAARLSQLVLSIDANDPETLACVGWGKAYLTDDFGVAVEMVDRAVSLNPNSSFAWSYRGMTCAYAGDAAEAHHSFERATRLSPLDPMLFGMLAVSGIALIGLGRFDEALSMARKAIGMHQTFFPAHCCLASALAHLGQEAEARQAVARMLELRPRSRTSAFGNRWPPLFVGGLRKAGLPE
jgi:adenylate cyclase